MIWLLLAHSEKSGKLLKVSIVQYSMSSQQKLVLTAKSSKRYATCRVSLKQNHENKEN